MDLKQAGATLRNTIRPADLCSVREAAMRARMNEFTIWKLIRQGKLKAYGRPGALRVSLGSCHTSRREANDAPQRPRCGNR